MPNPFSNRAPSLRGPARDIRPVTPDDNQDLGYIATSLYIETGGTINFVTTSGHTRQVKVDDYSMLPVGVRQVKADGTNASGIHAMVMI